MTPPRQIKQGTSYYVTVRAVNRSFRFVPTRQVRASIDYILAATLQKFRSEGRLVMHEFIFMSNHYHLLVTDLAGSLPDFVQELNSLLSRQLNSMRGIGGANIEKEYNLVEIVGDVRLTEHAVYTQLNAVRAGLVGTAKAWRGSTSARMRYGKAVVVKRPKVGLWKGAVKHAKRKKSKRSGRAAYGGRWKTPKTASLVIDRPAVMEDLSDEEYRKHIRTLVVRKEKEYAEQRKRPVLGWREVEQRYFLALPRESEEMFGRVPSFSSSFSWERIALIELRRRFIAAYRRARALYLAKRSDVVFPLGTWQLCRDYGAVARAGPS